MQKFEAPPGGGFATPLKGGTSNRNIFLHQPYFWAVCLLLASIPLFLISCRSHEPSATQQSGVQVIGSEGKMLGKFFNPRGVDVASDGRIAIADRTGRIQLFTNEGKPIREWQLPQMEHGTPTGLIFDESDPTTKSLIIADTHNFRIVRYSLEGRLIKAFGEYGAEPGKMIYPTNVAVDLKRNIYVTEYGENDRVLKFDSEGNFIKQWGSFGPERGQFQRPLSLVFAPPDRIIVADSCNHRIQEFNTDGDLKDVWGEVGNAPGKVSYPYDLAFGKDGLLYVCEYGNNRIQCFNAAHQSVGCIGGSGTKPGEFGTPWGLACGPDGRLYVADTNNHRVQILPPPHWKG